MKIEVEPTYYWRLAGFRDVYRARSLEFPNTPAFALWYTFDQKTIVLQLIELWEPDMEVASDDDSQLGEDD